MVLVEKIVNKETGEVIYATFVIKDSVGIDDAVVQTKEPTGITSITNLNREIADLQVQIDFRNEVLTEINKLEEQGLTKTVITKEVKPEIVKEI